MLRIMRTKAGRMYVILDGEFISELVPIEESLAVIPADELAMSCFFNENPEDSLIDVDYKAILNWN